MSIVTDSKATEDPKDPDSCTIFQIHKLLLEGRRHGVLSLGEYQTLVLPKVVELIDEELKRVGVAGLPETFALDVSEAPSL